MCSDSLTIAPHIPNFDHYRTIILNTRLKKQLAMAIIGCSVLARETSPARSRIEFPSTACSVFKAVPMTASQLRSLPAMVEIYKMLMMKAKKVVSIFFKPDWSGADPRKN